MPIGIMGSKSLALLDCIEVKGDSGTRNEKKRIILCCFLPPRWNTLRFTQATVLKPGVWKTQKSGSATGTGTATGTGEINEWFKLGSMIDINTPPPLSAFLARWMTIRWDWGWDGALIIQNIFDFVCRSRQYRAIAWNVSSRCENLSLLWVLQHRATK